MYFSVHYYLEFLGLQSLTREKSENRYIVFFNAFDDTLYRRETWLIAGQNGHGNNFSNEKRWTFLNRKADVGRSENKELE